MTSERPQTVLVTGAGGFVGRHLVSDQLNRGRKVRAIDLDLASLEPLAAHENLSTETVDVRLTDKLRPHLAAADIVFHLAAAHLDVLRDEDYFYDVNVRATDKLVRAAAEQDVRRFVHCSTVGVYGPLATLPATEETPPDPDIAYERSKLAGEAAVREAASGTPLEVVIARPSWVYGPYCPRTLKLIRTIARKRFFFVGDGSNRRHPVYVTDVLKAFELAATRSLPPAETILVAGPESVTVRQLVEIIVDELGMRYTPPRVPFTLMSAACLAIEKAAALARREPPFSRRSLKFFTESSAFDTEKAGRLLGFRPQVGTRQGLRMTIEHYRRTGLLPAPGSRSG